MNFDFKGKNILLVIHNGTLGGAERQGLGMSKILTEDYFCTVDLLLTFSSEMSTEFESFATLCHIRNIHFCGASYLNFPTKFSIKNFKRLKWSLGHLYILRQKLMPYNYDLIVPFLNFPSKIAFFLYKLLPSVKFTFWHQLGLDVFTRDVFEQIAARNIPCVIANSSNGIQIFTETYNVSKKKLNVLPQYVTLEFKKGNKAELRHKFGISARDIVIGMVAHFRPEKYHDLLLNTFESLGKFHPNIQLVFLGNKNHTSNTVEKYDSLQEKINQKNLSEKVHLFSEIDVKEFLSVLDIGVLVSRIEGMPNAVMEYMLYELPVISTNHPGCVELLKGSKYLIENSEEELYECLEELILSENLRIMEGVRNSERIKLFSAGNYIEKLERIINNYLH